jgi:hypothetical protein
MEADKVNFNNVLFKNNDKTDQNMISNMQSVLKLLMAHFTLLFEI